MHKLYGTSRLPGVEKAIGEKAMTSDDRDAEISAASEFIMRKQQNEEYHRDLIRAQARLIGKLRGDVVRLQEELAKERRKHDAK